MLSSDEGIKLGSTDNELVGFTLGVDHKLSFRIDEGTDMGSSVGFFDSSNEINTIFFLDDSLVSDYWTALGYSYCVSGQSQDSVIERLALVISLGSTDGIMLHYDEGIKLVSNDDELIGFPLVIYDWYIFGIE